MLGPGDVLVAQEQHLVLEQRRLDFGKQAGVTRRLAQVDAGQFGADMAGQGFHAHGGLLQITKIDEPVVRRDSRSRCACTASSRA
ncbi:hypothetical protein D3C85_1761900 [compost metagenome]